VFLGEIKNGKEMYKQIMGVQIQILTYEFSVISQNKVTEEKIPQL